MAQNYGGDLELARSINNEFKGRSQHELPRKRSGNRRQPGRDRIQDFTPRSHGTAGRGAAFGRSVMPTGDARSDPNAPARCVYPGSGAHYTARGGSSSISAREASSSGLIAKPPISERQTGSNVPSTVAPPHLRQALPQMRNSSSTVRQEPPHLRAVPPHLQAVPAHLRAENLAPTGETVKTASTLESAAKARTFAQPAAKEENSTKAKKPTEASVPRARVFDVHMDIDDDDEGRVQGVKSAAAGIYKDTMPASAQPSPAVNASDRVTTGTAEGLASTNEDNATAEHGGLGDSRWAHAMPEEDAQPRSDFPEIGSGAVDPFAKRWIPNRIKEPTLAPAHILAQLSYGTDDVHWPENPVSVSTTPAQVKETGLGGSRWA